MNRVGAIVLAAGKSSRFLAAGGSEETKLVAKLDGAPVVRMVAESALASEARPVVVVTGYARNSVEAALAGLPVEVAHNPDYSAGLASSLGVGLCAMPPDASGALVLLGDMPRIESRLIDALIDAFLSREATLAAAPLVGGRRGNPVLLGRGLFEAAKSLEGDEGARRLIGALGPGQLVEVAATDRGPAFDIDTPADLASARLLRNGDP